MSNTFRQDKNGKIRKEGLHRKEAHYKCRCERCRGKNREKDKVVEEDFRIELKNIIEEGIDCDIPEQDEILKQIMGKDYEI